MTISVFLADDNLIVREGVRALLNRQPDLEVVGVAAKELRKRHPGTGVVILSQYDDPEYAISLLSDGAAGYGYLLKDRLAEGDQLPTSPRACSPSSPWSSDTFPPRVHSASSGRPAATTTSGPPAGTLSFVGRQWLDDDDIPATMEERS